MTNTEQYSNRTSWFVMLSAATVLMVTFGTRAATGLFISPLNTASGLGIVTISFAIAIGQFVWGAVQPLFGAAADRWGPIPVVIAGAVMLAVGVILTPFVRTPLTAILALGVLSAAGSGAASFSILIGASSQRLPPERRPFAAGFINAGGSFGQFVFSRLAQTLIESFGWVTAMISLGATALLTIPLALPLRKPRVARDVPAPSAPTGPATGGLGRQLRFAMLHPGYLLLQAGFFTCGFHVAFLLVHLPGEVALCGLPGSVASWTLSLIGLFNIVGSLAAGALSSRYRNKNLLALIYLARAVILICFMLAPKVALTFYILGAALGATWLATIPTTAGLVAKFFGVRYLSTLFGVTILTHQVGAFFGAWLGGVAMKYNGNLDWMWYADIVLAVFAALINLPIKEAPSVPRAVPA